jgi:hypothetical protein
MEMQNKLCWKLWVFLLKNGKFRCDSDEKLPHEFSRPQIKVGLQ